MRFLIPFLAAVIAGCSAATPDVASVTLATTTSTRDSGLLDVLVPLFEQQSGLDVKVVAVGSGQAVELGRRGDADVLLTHAPDLESQFVNDGYGLARLPVMHNDFVLVGPPADPAQIHTEVTVTAAFAKLAGGGALFVSRGDKSGTALKEESIWKQLDVQPEGEWYLRIGSGMAETLRMASEKQAYTLSDRGTFLALRDTLELEVLSEGDPRLQNPYAVIVVNPARHPHVNAGGAQQFADFLLAPQTQAVIEGFVDDQSGETLFVPEHPPADAGTPAG